MSTKTILKKIAVVAVAALAIGGVSAVSANAATTPTPTLLTISPSTAQQGATITITGTNFLGSATPSDGSSYVTFQHRGNNNNNNNNNTVYVGSNTVVNSTTSLTTVVPAGIPAGQTRVRVVTNDGTNGDSVASGYLTLNVQLRAGIAACNVTSGVWEIDPAVGSANPNGPATGIDGLSGVDNCVITSPVYATVPQSASAALVLNAAHNAPAYADLTTYVVSAAGANKILGISGSISGIPDFTLQADGSYLLTSSDDVISGDQIGLSTANLGVTTVTWSKRVYTSAFTYSDTAVQKFIINVSNQTTSYVGTVVNGDPTSIASGAAAFDPLAVLNGATTVADASKAIFAPKGSGFTPAAAFYVHQLGSTGSPLGGTSTKAITVTLSGVGSVSLAPVMPNGGSVAYIALGAGNGNDTPIYLWADGRSGTSTLTISVNGVVSATKTVNFYGAVASLTPTPVRNYIKNGGTYTGAVSAVTAKDASGTVVPVASGLISVTASGTSVAYTDTTLNSGAVTGSFESHVGVSTTPLSKSGDKTTLTASYALPDGTFVTSASWGVTLGGSVATIVGAFDAASYALGAPFKITYTLKDSSGNVPADKPSSSCDYQLASNGPWSYNQYASFALAGQGNEWILCADGPVAGVATVSGFAPQTQGSGTWTIKYTDMDGATVRTMSAALEQDASTAAAADAAAEATDAANAATDAANAAAEAADAATAAAQDAADAVAALAAQVSTMISALKKQLIALTNLVIKIQKKVKA